MGDQMITDPSPNQQNRYSNSFSIASTANTSQSERGFTIVVPANVCFRGVNMQLDLKIDQKTLAAASDISKAVEEAVSTHFSSQGMSNRGDNTTSPRRVLRVPSTQSHVSFSISEPEFSQNGGTTARMDCDSSNEMHNIIMNEAERREQVNEVCSSTVDSSPMCDTASSPIELHGITGDSHSSATALDGTNEFIYSDDQRPTSSAVGDNEVHSSVEEVCENIASTSGLDNSKQPQTPSSIEGASPSPCAPHKRRRDKTSQPSHFCEQNDPGGKGQCRQRAILSFRYCIRHILLDPNAPYRQCQHKRKPKSKKDTNLYCTNAIRNDKDTVYCSTHMIMNGMMEPKKKKSMGVQQEEENRSNECDGHIVQTNWTTEECPQNEQQTQPPLQPLPSIMHCGFEQSQACVNEENDRWMMELSTMNSPVINETSSVQVKEHFSSREQTPFMGNPFPNTPVMQRNASYPPSVPTPSNMSSASYDEPCSLPANPSQMIDDSPCSSSMISPSPTKQLLVGPRATFPSPQFTAASPVVAASPVSNLTKQHPQLAAKLLQTSAQISSFPATTPQQTPSSAPPQMPVVVPRSEIAKAASSPMLPTHNAVLPWSAPLLLQRPPSATQPNFYSLDDLGDDERIASSPAPPKKKVIRLKQKHQRMKMIGSYRKIAAVDQMCKMLEDYDFDRTDLFPLGLEPSDDEGGSDTEPLQWYSAMDRRLDESPSSGAIEVYLLKKQLRLDRHTLLRQAQLNAPVMHASKKYPRSAGAALAHRAARMPLRNTTFQRRCTHMIVNGCMSPVRCSERCLPMSNHCAQHVLYNIHQRLFSYCSESCCGQPVLCVDSIFTSGMCRYHYELSRSESGNNAAAVDEKICAQKPQTSIPPISFLQQPVSSCVELPPLQQQYSVSLRDNTSSDCCTSLVPNMQRLNDPSVVGDLNENEGTETDVSLASVAKELGFDGRELNDMLAGLPAEDEDPGDFLHDHFSENLKEDEVVMTSNMDELGHSWADVEQFLLSEGYPVVLTPPSFTVGSPSTMLGHPSSGSIGSCVPSPASLPPQPPRPQQIPAADSLLPHRT